MNIAQRAQRTQYSSGSRVQGPGSREKNRALGVTTPVEHERKENGWYTSTCTYTHLHTHTHTYTHAHVHSSQPRPRAGLLVYIQLTATYYIMGVPR